MLADFVATKKPFTGSVLTEQITIILDIGSACQILTRYARIVEQTVCPKQLFTFSYFNCAPCTIILCAIYFQLIAFNVLANQFSSGNQMDITLK